MRYAVKFRRTCIIAILTLSLPLLFSLADADITISNVSPADGAIHIEIENNPPDPAGYVNLSWQLNDSNGGGDMEFYMDMLSPAWSGNGDGYWSYYREIWIDNTGGAEINNSYINITLNSTNFDFSKAQTDGDDIRFIDNASDILSGNDLTPDIVKFWYNSSNQSAKFSIKIPTITANTNYRIWVVYGNSEATWTGSDNFYISDDFSTNTTSEYERFDPDKWDYYFRYKFGDKTSANWTMEITDIDALNWGGGLYIGMSGENGTVITNRTYFRMLYNTDVGTTETSAVVRFYCQNSSGSTDSGSWDLVLTEGNTYDFKIIVTDTYCRGIITLLSGSEVYNKTLTTYIPEKLEYKWIGLMNYNDAGSVFEWSSSEGGYLHIKCQGGGNDGDDSSWIDTKLYYYSIIPTSPYFASLPYSIGSENTPSIPLGEWVNRLHLTNQNNGTWYHHEDEAPFNYTNSTCYWRIHAKDQTSGIWTNQTFTFTTDRVPDKPIAISPSNGSYVEKGDIPLSVAVNHPDYTFGWTSIDLDGANDDVRVPDNDTLNLTSSFTIDMALWIEDTPAVGKFDNIISKMTDANTGWGIALYSDDGTTWELHICVDGHNQSVGNATLPTETWVYLTVVFDNDTHTMYVYRNGTLVYSYNEPNTPSANTADLVIGECSYVGNDKTFDGKIDYIKLYDVALTPQEVVSNYYGKNDNGAERGLVSWWKFDENTGTTTSDSWGGNDGTLEDGATWATGTQSSTTYYGKIYNVTFYEYPSGRIIGWNYSTTGWTNGQIVKCNSTYHLEYEGTKYYWYAKAKDDEYWSDASDVYYVETYYNDTEPTKVYYSEGADIYVNPPYTESEPDKVYYSVGGELTILAVPHYHNPYPNATTDEWLNVKLSVQVNKTGDENYWDFTFLTNHTSDSSWVEIDNVNNIKVLNSSLTTITCWFSGLDWNTTYYWKVSAYNSTMDRYSNSSVYSFTTRLTDPEPDTIYHSIGSQIYVEPEYNETEPNIVYYSIGSQVNVYNIANLSNPYPVDGATGVWFSTPLRIDVNKTGDVMQLDIIFETNHTSDSSWVEINRVTQSFPPNATIQVWFSGLDWNTTYYWRVKAVNATTGMAQYSDIYHFTTLQNDTEPYTTYYSFGADIYVQPEYTETEPDVAYYSTGAEISLNKPHATEPFPANNTDGGFNELNFSVLITSVNSSDVIDNVTFYWYPSNTPFGTVSNVNSGERASVHVSGLTNYTWYQWYVRMENGNWNISSDIWRYRPHNIIPIVDEEPDNNTENVVVYRKLVGGSYKRFVRLMWNLTEPQGQGMSFILKVQDPSTGTWIQRWTILDFSATNGTYYHDEDLFNETLHWYNWSLWISDGYNETTYKFTFFTQFFIDLWWMPEYPTTDDTVHFYSLTEGADDWKWEFGNGCNTTGSNETIHQYLLAGYYNVTLWTYNATNDVWGSSTKTIRIDRNATLLTPEEGEAGYNYFAWQGNETNCSALSSILNITNGWIHIYNKTADDWDGYFINFGVGENSNISNWDNAVIVVGENKTTRINTTYNHSYVQQISLKTGYNLISWSNFSSTTASNLSFLENGEWVYLWDTLNESWDGYLKGIGGNDFDIKGYDTIVIYANSERSIRIGGVRD